MLFEKKLADYLLNSSEILTNTMKLLKKIVLVYNFSEINTNYNN